MKIIPLKDKHKLNEQDINNLSQWMLDGKGLVEMAYCLSNRLTPEQIYVAAGHIAKEMYDTPLAELCPDLVEERKALNDPKRGRWLEQKNENKVSDMFRQILEDLGLYELELMTRS